MLISHRLTQMNTDYLVSIHRTEKERWHHLERCHLYSSWADFTLAQVELPFSNIFL